MLSFMRFILVFFVGCAQAKQQINENDIVVPLIFKSWSPTIFVTIEKIKIPLQFDLGAANIGISLSPNILKNLKKVKYTGHTRTVRDSQGRKAILQEFILPDVQIANLKINNMKGIENHPFPWGSPGVAPEDVKNGVIGLGIVTKFNMIIDYKNRKLILIKGNNYPSHYNIDSWQKIPFTMNGNIVTNVKFGNKQIKLLLDTGVQFNLIKPIPKVSGDIRPCPKNIADILGMDANHCKEITANVTKDKSRLNKMTFYITSLQGLPVDGVIGEPFFKNHIVYINFSKKILAVSDLVK